MQDTSFSIDLTIWTFREGLLSRFGHDLALRIPADLRLSRASDGEHLDLHVEAQLRQAAVMGAVEDCRIQPERLSASDRAKILSAFLDEVAQVKRFPLATFTARIAVVPRSQTLTGILDLHGQRHNVTLDATLAAATMKVRAELKPSQWGIAPYRAMAGALKVADKVCVEANFAVPKLG